MPIDPDPDTDRVSDRGDVEAALDRSLVALAAEHGAAPADPPALLRHEFLERVEFFASFPGRAVAAEATRAFLPPATCYRLFQELEGRSLDGPVAITLTGRCARREAGYDEGRLPRFTMREVVVLGAEDAVTQARDVLAERSLDLASRLGLETRLEEAEDPFFTGDSGPQASAAEAGRVKRLLQRLLRLKVELVTEGPTGPLALASFNLHREFFGSRLGITVAGAPAWSGCAAWGMERWRLALFRRWGSGPGRWPSGIREAAGLAP